MAAGVVVRSIQYRADDGSWRDFETSEPLPASAFKWSPILVLRPDDGRPSWLDYHVCISGDVVMFNEAFPSKHVRMPFKACGDGMRSMP
jgi:hypothetical protein